ncbi:hypothetical protein H5399_17230 [Tessaracoccus sp. MC1627]|uniref:bleomycin resistance protein n=1 Tax=Tessaracoccus sp. MC1627 TaxID=2760312 RepID=UPI0015FF432E|nr:bleomycin resistance protein [Tessaracoccus sp. MC1627]MBB1514327.1 hypothetical protein [Tessaracoccus sp. MC1627]
MADHATPNLPSRDLEATVDFYGRLGFTVLFQDSGWLILERRGLVLEFFPDGELDPAASSFGACLRLDDVDAFYTACLGAGIPETTIGWPRLHRPRLEASGLRIGALIDPDGSLLRLVQNTKP